MRVKFRFGPLPATKNWHTWFAWYPVYCDESTFVWMEFVYRRRAQAFPAGYVWIYATTAESAPGRDQSLGVTP